MKTLPTLIIFLCTILISTSLKAQGTPDQGLISGCFSKETSICFMRVEGHEKDRHEGWCKLPEYLFQDLRDQVFQPSVPSLQKNMNEISPRSCEMAVQSIYGAMKQKRSLEWELVRIQVVERASEACESRIEIVRSSGLIPKHGDQLPLITVEDYLEEEGLNPDQRPHCSAQYFAKNNLLN